MAENIRKGKNLQKVLLKNKLFNVLIVAENVFVRTDTAYCVYTANRRGVC